MSDWFEGNGSGMPVDVVALVSDAEQALSELISYGALVSVGRTSDGGALGVTVTLDGRWRREYFRDSEALLDWLLGALEAVKAAPPRTPASSGRGSGRRGPRSL